MSEEHWSISLDDWARAAPDWLSTHQDGPASHYARYDGTRQECLDRLVAELRELADQMLYRSDRYGYPDDRSDGG